MDDLFRIAKMFISLQITPSNTLSSNLFPLPSFRLIALFLPPISLFLPSVTFLDLVSGEERVGTSYCNETEARFVISLLMRMKNDLMGVTTAPNNLAVTGVPHSGILSSSSSSLSLPPHLLSPAAGGGGSGGAASGITHTTAAAGGGGVSNGSRPLSIAVIAPYKPQVHYLTTTHLPPNPNPQYVPTHSHTHTPTLTLLYPIYLYLSLTYLCPCFLYLIRCVD